jgi:hypothetical protein
MAIPKKIVDEAINYASSNVDKLNSDYLDIILQYIDEIENTNKELKDQVFFLKSKLNL